MSVLIEAKLDDPIVDGIGPFTVGQKLLGLYSQCTKKSRNVSVTPADENYLSWLSCTQVSCQFSRLTVAKAGINSQFFRLRKWFDCQARPLAFR